LGSSLCPSTRFAPFPLLAAVGAKTSRIEIGIAVIDLRYENPLYMAEDAGAG
jgi:alkanesulfonate monooxygenase SsuD/methylene tetrahydromethanopterin reductase-like flavin-dependent oxidoreductase (luciferase family)